MKILSLVSFLVVFSLIISSGCNSKKSATPCDNKGKVCILNKLDSTITVDIMQVHTQFVILKNNEYCVTLEGDQPYKFTITGPHNDIRDTTFIVVGCDNILVTVQ